MVSKTCPRCGGCGSEEYGRSEKCHTCYGSGRINDSETDHGHDEYEKKRLKEAERTQSECYHRWVGGPYDYTCSKCGAKS